MNRINILDDLTINKIAAGEVVERPSSVVKELIENCIDAGASKVVIDIADGGKKFIKIIDNGSGIASSEVDKSFLRHATSKISKIDDLYDLYSLGFRGEALASISAVSKLDMITKTKDEPVGTKVYVEGGKIISKEPAGANNGTTIIIKDIFYNTPVRQKFLKSTHAETINISDLINKLAIGNPSVQFKYVNNNKPMLNTPGDGKLTSVIRSIYGKDVCENLIEVNYDCKYFKISGFVGNNNVYRSNKNLQHIYINKRFVKSKVILDAISEAYKSIIPINKHAVCFLNMQINPASIDVNIHPTKLEIKFENEQELYIELRDYLRSKLLSSSLIGKYEVYDKNKIQPRSINNLAERKIEPFEKEHKKIEVIEIDSEKPIDTFLSVNDIINKSSSINEESNKNLYMNENIKEANVYSLEHSFKENKDDFNAQIDNMYKSQAINELQNISENLSIYNIDVKEDEQQNFFEEKIDDNRFSLDDYNVIGTIFDTYIILSKGNSMYLLDQHAAHERVLYERYMNKFYKSDINMQLLLNPIVVELSNVDMLKAEENLELFKNFGFEIDIFGNNHIMIRCVPTIFGVPESEKFILQIIDNIDEIKNNYELKGERFASMACRSAIKANDKINTLEIKSLFEQMKECKNPFTCPHGRPIIVEISKTEIEKMFKRIM
ncbi:DNA mismatch repair endonuclease MutL [Clostridium sp. CCUG 7971]|uniref:DNA mismatch repair endonuclease MutL n=1 Tax=Clostridium sp. CCUG 7971 TaxID=2811414 RepID=UPI001ABAC75C|nr:DNA mismatch repair endonuclease MutL [Clostridium sp. CCUG 7971]MBO3442964.1 DNA mismatch repair endonuclease MutL [Clostridium sp. CCUG 7971]